MYGWRARVGMLMANANTTMEPEFYKLAPEGVSMHASRVPIGGVSVKDMTTDSGDLAHAVKLIAQINARVIAYSCNGSNIVGGLDGEAEQARLIRDIAGCPAVPAATAVLEALTALKARRVAFATVYPPDLNEANTRFWRDCGIKVVRTDGIDMSQRVVEEPYTLVPVSRIGLQEPYLAYNLARHVCDSTTEAVVVIGGNLRTIEAARAFERDFGIPFVSTNLALLWASLQVAGVRDPVSGYGRLLETQPPLPYVRLPRD